MTKQRGIQVVAMAAMAAAMMVGSVAVSEARPRRQVDAFELARKRNVVMAAAPQRRRHIAADAAAKRSVRLALWQITRRHTF